MAKQVQHRRGTAAELDAFTGASGEFTFDTTNKRIRAHDGTTLGGIAMAKLAEVGSVALAYITGLANTWAKPQKSASAALTSGVAIDAGQNAFWKAAPNGSTFTIANPTNGITDQHYLLVVDYTTSHGLAFGTAFKGLTGIVPTATAGARDAFSFLYDGTVFSLIGHRLNIKV